AGAALRWPPPRRRGLAPSRGAGDAGDLSHELRFVCQCDDRTRSRDVTVDESTWLAERFEAHRSHLRAVAYRMLGSLAEADDAVQDSWLRPRRRDTSGHDDPVGYPPPNVAPVCRDLPRSP